MRVRAVIDRIEDGYHAVLLVEGEEIEVDWPAKYLPECAKEGDILNFTINIDQEKTEKQRKKVSNLIEKLKNKQSKPR